MGHHSPCGAHLPRGVLQTKVLTLRAARLSLPTLQAPRWRVVLPMLAVLWGLYLSVLHPWLMSWGATASEVAMRLPGDELPPTSYFTRGITIEAPVSAVWPWIVQIGQDRAGFYSNTWLENLTGADIHNADEIHAEWQQRAVGDRVPLARPDLLGGLMSGLSHTDIVALEPLVMIANTPGRLVLQAVDGDTTRLLVRESIESQGPAVSRWLAWDPLHFVMVQRMLRGIKERAEGGVPVSTTMLLAARLGWALAALTLLGTFLARRRRRLWLTLPVALALGPLSATGDWDAALAAFLAVGTTVVGALALGRRWWESYPLLAAGVMLVLLLAPDPYVAFGLTFDFIGVLAGGYYGPKRLESNTVGQESADPAEEGRDPEGFSSLETPEEWSE